ncbi:transposase [Streptomyces sp. NPDC005574]|uniref:IS110 family transposase n=1 Tax=Streptomyces sp. NPDC005574 TaxID=3156891 RepID=UPI0033B6CAAD
MPTALPFLSHRVRGQQPVILIGVDPHKSSHTAVAVDAAGHQVAQRRFVVNAGTFRQLTRWCEQWPDRRFAVEGAGGLGRSLAQQHRRQPCAELGPAHHRRLPDPRRRARAGLLPSQDL